MKYGMVRSGVLSLMRFICALAMLASFAPRPAHAQQLARFDFTLEAMRLQWGAQHDISQLQTTNDGLKITITGNDPYIIGPARDYPVGSPLWLHVRLKSDQSGTAQAFYFAPGGGPDEEHSVRFAVRGGRWEEARVPLPALGAGSRLRFDPPGSGGTCVLSSISIESRPAIAPPVWPHPTPPVPAGDDVIVQSGLLSVTHAHHQLGGFVVRVGDQVMAVGHTRPLVGYIAPNAAHTVRWLDVTSAATMTATRDGDEIIVRATCHDPDGATWYLNRSFHPAAPGTMRVLTTVQTDRDRAMIFLPMFLMLAGSSPTPKNHALFAGLEYLDGAEPSSSEADIRGPGSHRQTPDTAKITFPLMAVTEGANYLGLIWDKPQEFTALFDSPDRVWNTGGTAMGLLYPGSDGSNREEGSLLPYAPRTLKANQPLILSALLVGGRGRDVTPAIQQYVGLRGLPPIPKTGLKWGEYVNLAASGFLDSGIYDADRYRHAYPGSPPQPVGDVALFLDWLAEQTRDSALGARLRVRAQAARALVPDNDLNFAGIGHIRTPAPALLYGHVEANAARAQQNGYALLSRFQPDGTFPYHAPPGKPDLGATHFAPDANGLTAQVVADLLQSAVISGDSKLLEAGITRLRGLDKFADMAPRGAQTWEVPLHTPDILASANLLRAYTLGYEITGDPHLLEQARYWAWTGVPFVYLVNPTEGAMGGMAGGGTGSLVGPYATIAVYGATQWVSPNWMGLPVQWCGLVYADALYRFAKYDLAGPWQQIANGITASGIQQTWPRDLDPARQGLLPDSFNLKSQSRNDVAINPGTLLVNALRLYNRPALYDFQAFRDAGVFVHASGDIENPRIDGQIVKDAPTRTASASDPYSQAGTAANNVKPSSVAHVKSNMSGARRLSFTVKAWTSQPTYILVSGLHDTPTVRINRQTVDLTAPNQYTSASGRLILQIQGTSQVEITADRH